MCACVCAHASKTVHAKCGFCKQCISVQKKRERGGRCPYAECRLLTHLLTYLLTYSLAYLLISLLMALLIYLFLIYLLTHIHHEYGLCCQRGVRKRINHIYSLIQYLLTFLLTYSLKLRLLLCVCVSIQVTLANRFNTILD